MTTPPESPEPNGRVHPAAQLFPMLDGEELEALAQSIKDGGLMQPGVLLDGTLLDGRNRKAACELVDVPMRWTPYEGTDPVGDVLRWNLKRRHLTPSQVAAIGASLLDLLEEDARKRMSAGGQKSAQGQKGEPNGAPPEPNEKTKPVRAAAQAAAMTGASTRNVQRAKRVKEKDPKLFKKVAAGTVTVGAAEHSLKPAKSDGRTPHQQLSQVAHQLREKARITNDYLTQALEIDWSLDLAKRDAVYDALNSLRSPLDRAEEHLCDHFQPAEGAVCVGDHWAFGTRGAFVEDATYWISYRRPSGIMASVPRDVTDDTQWRPGVEVLPDADAPDAQ